MSHRETDEIYGRMPLEDRARVDRLSPEMRRVLISLWANVKRDGLTGEEIDARARDAEDEKIMLTALAGKVTDAQGRNAERFRMVIEQRVATCPRVTGKTMEQLKKDDRAAYRRFLRGCTRAIKREAAIASGDLSAFELAELRRRYNLQRDIDRYDEEFPDFQDYGEAVSP